MTADLFHRDGPRENFEYRDLGLAAATGGQVGVPHSGVAYSDDLELIEVNRPASYATTDLSL